MLLAACGDNKKAKLTDASTSDGAEVPDASPPPPPTIDAGPAPSPACGNDPQICATPPLSVCLDAFYLVYYTDGQCTQHRCHFTTNLLYCPYGCMNGGCFGGFT